MFLFASRMTLCWTEERPDNNNIYRGQKRIDYIFVFLSY